MEEAQLSILRTEKSLETEKRHKALPLRVTYGLKSRATGRQTTASRGCTGARPLTSRDRHPPRLQNEAHGDEVTEQLSKMAPSVNPALSAHYIKWGLLCTGHLD